LDASFKESISLGYINGADFNLLQVGMNDLVVPTVIAPKHEIRSIRATLALTDQEYYNSANTGGNA